MRSDVLYGLCPNCGSDVHVKDGEDYLCTRGHDFPPERMLSLKGVLASHTPGEGLPAEPLAVDNLSRVAPLNKAFGYERTPRPYRY